LMKSPDDGAAEAQAPVPVLCSVIFIVRRTTAVLVL
jgi:hypothetical protein